MMQLVQKINQFLVATSLSLIILFSFSTLAFAAAGTPQFVPVPADVCQGEVASNPACTAGNEDPITGANGVIMRIANITAFGAGAIAVIMIIFAGFRLVKSGGDPSKVTVARETIIYALVGIIVIVTARLIVGFVISKL